MYERGVTSRRAGGFAFRLGACSAWKSADQIGAEGKGRAEIVHNLAEFDEIILESRRKYHGKYLVVLALICGGFIIWKRSFPVWVCAPFFLFAALIIFAWFKVGIQYLVLRRADETVEYRLRDTPAFVEDFFEKMSANVRSANANVRFYLHRKDAEDTENEYKRTDSK